MSCSLIGFLLILGLGTYIVNGSSDERRLIHDLLDNYNVMELPVQNSSEPVKVLVQLSLMALEKLDVQKREMTAQIWLSMDWNDQNLRWNKSDYGNVSIVRVFPNRIWMPDLFITTRIEPASYSQKTKAVIIPDGNVSFVEPETLTFSCSYSSIAFYPFDHQYCVLKLSFWTHDGSKVSISPMDENGDYSTFYNDEWELKEFLVRKNTMYFGAMVTPYEDLTFTIHVQRNGESIYSSAQCFTFLLALTAFFALLLPPQSPWKLIFGIFFKFRLFGLFLKMSFICEVSVFFLLSIKWLASVVQAAKGYFTYYPGSYTIPYFALYFEKLGIICTCIFVCGILTHYVTLKTCGFPNWLKKVMDSRLCRWATNASFSKNEDIDNDTKEENKEEDISDKSKWAHFALFLDQIFFVFWTVFLIIFSAVAFPYMSKDFVTK